uniref:EF-hand domain-containing protein n=1 Tax=Branchiostoma floridae TaxID=7739 RepID=C3ZF73_BRAFL|eukprot:XP_002593368.1 hypothetical protein BRAFLDRAFT_70859 [Branchiostoma floridae]
MADIKAIFDKHDVNKDGFISASELKAVLKEFDLGASEHLVGEFIKECDKNGNGKLELDEFKTVIKVLQEAAVALEDPEKSAADMRDVCKEFDKNGDGFLTKAELQEGMQEAMGMSAESCEKLLSVADKNGDGKLDYNEFVNVLVNK